MRFMHYVVIMSLFVGSVAFANPVGADVQVQDVDASCAEDICLNNNGEQVACESDELDASDDRGYCFFWKYRWNRTRGWHHHHHGHRHRW